MAHVQIFLSTVSAEFGSYREALRRYLDRPNVTVKVQEDFIATGTETLDKLDEYIRQCHAVVHLVGDMTGALAQAPSVAVIRQRYPKLAECLPVLGSFLDPGAPALSYTQWEAWLALYHRKVLIIAAPEDGAPRDKHYQLVEDQRAAQQAHLARLKKVERYPEICFANAALLAVDILRSKLQDILALAGAGPKMNWKQLCDICDKITHGQMETVRWKHQKPGLYLQRKHVRQQFKTFLANREQHGFVLVGTSGVGKSNFLLALSEELRTRDRNGPENGVEPNVCVLMYDAANMRLSSIPPITTIKTIISEDFADQMDPPGQEVQEVWREIRKIDGIEKAKVVFCIDAINQNPKAAELLEQLDDLVRKGWGWLKIVLSCRRETWPSIRSGVKLAESFYYREQGSNIAEVELKPFSCQEFKEVYARYQQEYLLETPYESLSNEMRETLRDPLNLWLVAESMHANKRKAVPETVKVSELIALYVSALRNSTVPERILEKEDQWFLERELVPFMVGVGHYSNVITDDDLNATDEALYDKVFRPQMNESFLRLVDAEILVQQKLGADKRVKFKHERFYEHFVGERIASLSETQADRYAFFLELIEEIAGKKEATDETKTTSKPFLWGAVRNALVKEARNSNSETILKLCRTTEQRVKEMMVNVLVTLGRDFPKQVDGI